MRSFFLCIILLAASVTADGELFRLATSASQAVGTLRPSDFYWTGQAAGQGSIRAAQPGEKVMGLSTFASAAQGVLVFHLN